MRKIISVTLSLLITISCIFPANIIAEDAVSDFEASAQFGDEINSDAKLTFLLSETPLSGSVGTDTVKLYKDGYEVALGNDNIEINGKEIVVNYAKEPYCVYTVELLGTISSESGKTLGEDVAFSCRTISESKELKLSGSSFLSAIYDPSNPEHTGDRKSNSGGSGWLPYLCVSGKFRYYYCRIDISSLAGKDVSEVIYTPYINGSVNASLYELEGDFVPGTTPYSELPEPGDVFCTVVEAAGNGKYINFDVTNQVKKLLSDGKDELLFMLRQNIANQSSIANESSQWSDGSWGPKVNIKYSDSSFRGVTTTVPASSELGVNVDSDIEVTFSKTPQAVSASNVSLVNEHKNQQITLSDTDITFDETENKLVINPSDSLEPMTVYMLEIDGLEDEKGNKFSPKKIHFKTDGTPGENVLYSSPSGTSFAEVRLSDDYSGDMVIKGKLFGCGNSTINLAVSESDSDEKTPVYTNSTVANSNGYFTFDVELPHGGDFKAYISSPSSLEKGIVTSEFTCYPESEFQSVWAELSSGDADGIKSIISRAFDMYQIFDDNKKVFELSDGAASVVALNGSFGEYTRDNIETMRDALLDAYLISGFESEKNIEKLQLAVDTYSQKTGISDLDNYGKFSSMDKKYKDMVLADFAENVRDNIKSFNELCEDFYNSIQNIRIQMVFDSIKSASNYSVVSDLILDESTAILLGLSADEISDFKSNSKNASKYLCGKTFESLADFKSEFSASLYEEDSRVNGGGGGSFGGGGGSVIKGGSGSLVVSTQPDDNQSSAPTNTKSENVDSSYFNDLNGYDWAKKEIEFMYRMGVINGTGEKTYSPSLVLTREQLVKLIVQTFEFETASSDFEFDDVTDDMWFYAYLSTAHAYGIVEGNGTSFGTGDAITRQDLCVMALRALNAAGYKTSDEALTFTDASKVSDYAKSAVAFLAKEGIVGGMPDGSFMPQSGATRAEAAVIIYRLSEYIKNFSATIWKAASNPLDTVEAPTESQILADINKKLNKKTVKHPYIHGTYDKLVEIKENIASGDEYSLKLYEMVKKSADGLIGVPPVAPSDAVSQGHTSVEGRILALMVMHFIDGDDKYLNQAMREFNNLQKITRWTASAQLDNTQTAAAISVCYDWLYDYLTEQQRDWAVKTIKEKCVDIAYEYYKDPSKLSSLRAANDNMNIWCWRGSYNHCVYNNSNLAVCALALAPEYPEYSAFVLYNNMYNIQPYFELVGRDGGHEEPVGYYGYTTGKAMNMLSAIQSALGTMYDYDRYYGFRTTAYYPLYIYGVGPFAFGDCSPATAKFNSNFLYFAAKYSKNSELLSLINDRLTSDGSAKVLLWYDKGELNNIEDGVELSLDKKLSPVSMGQNVVAFRDTWDIERGFFAAMYAGNGNANGHSDPVSGAFGIDAYGERFITPMGIGSYDYPDYWANTQEGGRWNWYEKRPEGNNCLVINPSEAVGQKVNVTAVFDKFESDVGGAYAITDLSGVYADYAVAYKRGMKIHDSRSKIVVQDEALLPEPSEIFWSVNTPGEIRVIDENTALITLNGKKLAVKVWANAEFELFEMAAEKLPTSPQKEEQRVLRAYRKLAVRLYNVTDLKLMVEFIPVATEYEIPETISGFTALDSWTADSALQNKPKLNSIIVGDTSLEGFDSGIYNYNIKLDSVPETLPEVKASADDGVQISVSYPDGEIKKAVVKAEKDGVATYYEILFTQKPAEIDINSLTKYKPASVSATDNDGNIPENAVDGNPASRWSASGQGQKPCLDIDLGGVKNLKAIGMAFYEGTKRQSYFEIYTSNDGQNWTKNIVLGESSGKSNDMEYFTLDVSARYVRYEGQQNSLNHWNSVTEIEIYGE